MHAGAVYRVLDLLPESLQADPDADAAVVSAAVAQALFVCLCSNVDAGRALVATAAAGGILAKDPTVCLLQVHHAHTGIACSLGC